MTTFEKYKSEIEAKKGKASNWTFKLSDALALKKITPEEFKYLFMLWGQTYTPDIQKETRENA